MQQHVPRKSPKLSFTGEELAKMRSNQMKLRHDFTEERKPFREEHGYPPTRPTLSWYDNK